MRGATAACHPERSAAESKDPAKLPNRIAMGLKAWPRPESFRGCVAASIWLGMTVLGLSVSSFSLILFRVVDRITVISSEIEAAFGREQVCTPVTDACGWPSSAL